MHVIGKENDGKNFERSIAFIPRRAACNDRLPNSVVNIGRRAAVTAVKKNDPPGIFQRR